MKAVTYGHWSKDGFVEEGEVAVFSAREFEVLGIVCQGRTNRQIAAKIGISEGTIKNYVAVLTRDLGCSNRTELALKVTQGIVKIARSPYLKRNHGRLA